MKGAYYMSLVPMVLEREGNGERAMDLFSRLLKERIVIVQGPVEAGMANIVKGSLLYLESEDPEAEISMYIDSPGGEISTGMGIVDVMNYVSCDIRTICFGMAASMGSVILTSGTKGKRMALPNSEIMIHQLSTGAQGKFSDIERSFEHARRTKERMADLYVRQTGMERETIVAALDRDTWFTPEEAIEFGLIDQIVTSRKEIQND